MYHPYGYHGNLWWSYYGHGNRWPMADMLQNLERENCGRHVLLIQIPYFRSIGSNWQPKLLMILHQKA